MEKTFFVTEEQKQILYEATHLVHGEMFAAICAHDNSRFDNIIKSALYQCNDVDAICVMRLGTPHMQKTYWKNHSKFTLQAEKEMFLHADSEFVQSILDNWPLELEIFKAILERGDIKIIADAINFCTFDDADTFLAILKERNRPLELALYYNTDPDSTPEGFWMQEENIKLLENNLELFSGIAPNIFQAIIDRIELRQRILYEDMLYETSTSLLVASYQAQVQKEEIKLLAKAFNPSMSDFNKLYQHSKELFELVVKNCEISWEALWNCQEKSVVISEIAKLRLTEHDVSEKMFDNPNGAELVWILKNKELWNNNYLSFVHKYPSLLSELRRYLEFNQEADKSLLDDINIWKLNDFDCTKAYIERFGISKENEHYIEQFNKRKEREELVCLVYDKCGFRSKAGKRLWRQYCKYNPNDKRVSFIDRIKAYFC